MWGKGYIFLFFFSIRVSNCPNNLYWKDHTYPLLCHTIFIIVQVFIICVALCLDSCFCSIGLIVLGSHNTKSLSFYPNHHTYYTGGDHSNTLEPTEIIQNSLSQPTHSFPQSCPFLLTETIETLAHVSPHTFCFLAGPDASPCDSTWHGMPPSLGNYE